MKILNKIIFSTLLFTTAGSAYATLIDFKADANITERGYDPLTYAYTSGSLNITAFDGANSAFAYMDKGNAGLGACPKLDAGNQCNPSSDDNVRINETVRMIWDTNVLITGIWFNNNHDSDFRLDGDTISIGGDNYVFSASDFDISWVNDQFYISAIEFETVPEPGMLALLSVGLMGLLAARRRM